MLVVENNGCKDSLKLNNYIHIKAPIANFAYQYNCKNPFIRNFKDKSIGATTWFWDFGDGTTSTVKNPSHTYLSTGYFEVTLTVSNDTCSYTKKIRLQ